MGLPSDLPGTWEQNRCFTELTKFGKKTKTAIGMVAISLPDQPSGPAALPEKNLALMAISTGHKGSQSLS
jgi:hypothetical protein